MALDANIILQGRGVQLDNPLEMASRAMTLRHLGQQTRLAEQELAERQGIKDAYSKNLVTGPDGQVSINQKAALSDLYKASPMKAEEVKKAWAAADDEARHKNTKIARELAWSVNDPQSYNAMLARYKELGLPNADKLPLQYDPQWVRGWQMRTLEASEQLAQMNKERELNSTEAKNKASAAKDYAETAKIRGEISGPRGGMKLTEGQKAVDKDFAKDYNDWTAGGSDIARSEIGKLQSVVNNLKSGQVTTGGLTGAFPDRMTSNAVLRARADVQSTVMNSLRAILGAQFTENEGKRIIANTWNEADSTENNVARLERLVGDLEAKAEAKTAKARYFERNASLSGFQAGGIARRDKAPGQPSKGASGSWGINEAQAAPVLYTPADLSAMPLEQLAEIHANMTRGK